VETVAQGMSILIPCYNEHGNIKLLIDEIEEECHKFPLNNVEIIWIDDASDDAGFADKKIFPERHKVVRNYRRLGQSLSLAKGFAESKFNVIAVLDGDHQNVPNDLFTYYDILKDSPEMHMIQGRRVFREDNLIRRLPSKLANKFIRKISGSNFTDLGCATKIMRRELCLAIPFRGEIHRIYALHAHMGGFNILEMDAKHRSRKFGKSKYGLKRFFKFMVDILFLRFKFAVTEKPIYVFGSIAFGMLIVSFGMFSIAFFLRLTGVKDYLDGALVIGSVVLFIAATLTLFISFILEILLQKLSVMSNELKK